MNFDFWKIRKTQWAALTTAAISLFGPADVSAQDESAPWDSHPMPYYRMEPLKKRFLKKCYQGFGTNWHLGLGYGGRAIGVGQDGGYPNYGGPGYPQPMPELNRHFCKITPFPYNGNPGGPTPDCPHYYGIPGPLSESAHAINYDDPTIAPLGGYGIFSGTVPYPESVFTPSPTPISADQPPKPSGPTVPDELPPSADTPPSRTPEEK